jgi:hypothetical protein
MHSPLAQRVEGESWIICEILPNLRAVCVYFVLFAKEECFSDFFAFPNLKLERIELFVARNNLQDRICWDNMWGFFSSSCK